MKISGALVELGNVFQFQWSPDASRLAFSAVKEIRARATLYVVSADGGEEAVRVSGSQVMAPNENGPLFAWSPDSTHVAFRSDRQIDSPPLPNPIYIPDTLFVAPADGNVEPINVSGESGNVGPLNGLRIARDSAFWPPSRAIALFSLARPNSM